MEITKYIGDLLFDYECVVIPGLGGFVTNDKPASVNYSTNHFTPAFRKIMFNPYLSANDGLLAQYISKNENISYKQAKQSIENFVNNWKTSLEKGNRVYFDNIGFLYKDENNKIVFEQDISINYNPDSFGLSSFVSPAIKKIKHGEQLKDSFAFIQDSSERKKNNRIDKRVSTNKKIQKIRGKKYRYKRSMFFTLLIILLFFSGWLFLNFDTGKKLYNEYSYKIPLFYSNSGSYIANNVEIFPLEQISNEFSDTWLVKQLETKDVVKNKQKKDIDNNIKSEQNVIINKNELHDNSENTVSVLPDKKSEVVIETNKIEYDDKASVEEVKPSVNTEKVYEQEYDNGNNYLIIAGSFKERANAEKLINILRSKGYDAIFAGTNNLGMVRVAYSGYKTWREAKEHLLTIRKYDNPSAWIMRK